MMSRTMGSLLSVMLLASWLGAALLVAAAVAPAAFALLPTRELAGALVGRILPVVFWSGIMIGAVVAAMSAANQRPGSCTTGAAVLALACGAAQLAIGPRISAARTNIGGAVDALDPSDPRRQLFGRLHALSVGSLGVAILAALFTLLLLVRLLTSRAAA